MKLFNLNIPTKVHIGMGALDTLSEVCIKLGTKAFIVTTGNDMRDFGILGKAEEKLVAAGIGSFEFNHVTPNPKSSEIDEGAAAFRREGCDFIITLGGGSSIDAGKNISMTVANDASIYDFLPGGSQVAKIDRKSIPLVAIPTTAGTGSEVTKTAVVTNDRTNQKYGVRNDCIYPSYSIVDPDLMLSLPKMVSAVTGIDVFFHAMEAYLSNKATPFSDMVAEHAMRLVVDNLEKVLMNGKDIEARSNMAWASTLGGIALDNAICVGIHGLGQPVGGHIDAVHGKTLCAVCHAYMKYTWKSDPERYAHITEILGVTGDEYSREQKAEMSGDVLESYLSKQGLNITLSEIGIREDMIPVLARSVLNTTKRTLECCKMDIGYDDIVHIYRQAL